MTSSTSARSWFMMQLRKQPAPPLPSPPRQPGFRLFHNYCWTAWVLFNPFWLTQPLAGIVEMAAFVASKEPRSKDFCAPALARFQGLSDALCPGQTARHERRHSHLRREVLETSDSKEERARPGRQTHKHDVPFSLLRSHHSE